jgi:hypothetical protein
MKAYLVTTGALFGLIAVMHLLRSIAEWPLLATDPWYFLCTSALGVVAAALLLDSPDTEPVIRLIAETPPEKCVTAGAAGQSPLECQTASTRRQSSARRLLACRT